MRTGRNSLHLGLAILLFVGGVSCSESVTEPAASVESVVLTPSELRLTLGTSASLTAMPRTATGQLVQGRNVSWSSGSQSIATVSLDGTVTAVGVGTTAVEATVEGRSATATVTVTPVPVASVVISPEAASVTVGATTQLSATPRDTSGNALSGRTVTWTTSNAGIATVSTSGLVTGVAAGSATITAASEGQSATATVTVTPVPVASVVISPEDPSVFAGDSLQIVATALDISGNSLAGREVTWTVSDPSVAIVSGVGTVRGVSTGLVEVRASIEGRDAVAILRVMMPNGLPQQDALRVQNALNLMASTGNLFPADGDIIDVVLRAYPADAWQGFFDTYLNSFPLNENLSRFLGRYAELLPTDSRLIANDAGLKFATGLSQSSALKARQILMMGQSAMETPQNALALDLSSGVMRGIRNDALYAALLDFYHRSGAPQMMSNFQLRRIVGSLYLSAFQRLESGAATPTEIAQELRLSPAVTAILEKHGMLVADHCIANLTVYCGKLDANSTSIIRSILSAVNPTLYRRGIMTVENAIGLYNLGLCCFFGISNGVPYISLIADTNNPETPFPPDADQRTVSIFSSVLHHEFGHEVDNYLYTTDARYRQERDRLIEAAGSVTREYIRGDIIVPNGDFFPRHPQELLASFFQVYFADSENTITSGIRRYSNGFRQPIRQALWLAEVLSAGGSLGPIFLTARDGSLTKIDAPIERSPNGYITKITIQGRVYEFERSDIGEVTAIRQ